MRQINLSNVQKYVEDNIGTFHSKRLQNLKKAKRILGTNISQTNIVAVNGCCYGRDNQPDKGEYLKYCGQKFWEFISGNRDLYVQIIEPLGHRAKEKNEEFLIAYSKLVNKFTFEFGKEFCVDGEINWDSLVKYNSSDESPKNNST